MTNSRKIGPIGTTARVVIGLLIVALALALDFPRRGITWWEVVAVLVVLPATAIGAAALLNTAYRHRPADVVAQTRSPWSAAQARAAALVIVTVAAVGTVLTFLTPIHPISIYLFFGLSMLLAAVRGYDGCEMLALPNVVLRRQDAIWCPLYTPFDTAEQRAMADRGSAA